VRKHHPFTAVCCLFLLIGALSPAAAKDYEIRFSRPSKVGDTYRLSANSRKKETAIVSKDGNVLQKKSEDKQATLQAVVEILKVNKTGNALKKSVTIEKFVDGQSNALLEKGQTVTAQTIENKTVFRIDGKPLPEKARAALADIVKTKTSSVNDDMVFGTKTRRQVGDSWKINTKAAAKDLKEMQVKPKDLSGTVTFKAVEQHKGQECLRLSGVMTVKSLPQVGPLKKLLDQGFEIRDPVMTMKFGGLFPTDLKRQRPADSFDMTVKARFVGVKGAVAGVEIQTNVHVTVKYEMTPLEDR